MTIENQMIRKLRSHCYSSLPGMITCVQFEEFVVDYLDGNLAAIQRLIFNTHLVVCRECRDYLAAYRRSIELGKAAFSDPNARVPESVPEDLIAAILAARKAGD